MNLSRIERRFFIMRLIVELLPPDSKRAVLAAEQFRKEKIEQLRR